MDLWQDGATAGETKGTGGEENGAHLMEVNYNPLHFFLTRRGFIIVSRYTTRRNLRGPAARRRPMARRKVTNPQLEKRCDLPLVNASLLRFTYLLLLGLFSKLNAQYEGGHICSRSCE